MFGLRRNHVFLVLTFASVEMHRALDAEIVTFGGAGCEDYFLWAGANSDLEWVQNEVWLDSNIICFDEQHQEMKLWHVVLSLTK
jgi:hypothetical protein